MSPWEGPCIKIAFQKKKEPDEEKPEKEKDKLNDFVICPGCEKLCKIQRGLDQNGRFCVCESKDAKEKLIVCYARRKLMIGSFRSILVEIARMEDFAEYFNE